MDKRWFYFEGSSRDGDHDLIREWATDEETARLQAVDHCAGTGFELDDAGRTKA